jgi:hypothetical protein
VFFVIPLVFVIIIKVSKESPPAVRTEEYLILVVRLSPTSECNGSSADTGSGKLLSVSLNSLTPS